MILELTQNGHPQKNLQLHGISRNCFKAESKHYQWNTMLINPKPELGMNTEDIISFIILS
jgi:hypothetical protein